MIQRAQVIVEFENAYQRIKGKSLKLSDTSVSLVNGLHLESIDIIDLLFELEQATGTDMNLARVASKAQTSAKRKFMDLLVEDIITYIVDESKV